MKTWKREIAAGLLLFLCLLAAATWYEPNTRRLQVLEMLVVPIFGFAGAAFGADWWAKQRHSGSKS